MRGRMMLVLRNRGFVVVLVPFHVGTFLAAAAFIDTLGEVVLDRHVCMAEQR
jgi:hypothetical protein